jgi:hypothetical protein
VLLKREKKYSQEQEWMHNSYPVLKQPPNKRKQRTTNNIPLALIRKKNAEVHAMQVLYTNP